MLFHSSIRKEMARSFGATVVVLATIVMTMLLVRTLSLAQRGNVNPTEVVIVLGYTVLGHAPTILTLSLFVAIVGTLSRMYRDSEMVIWFSAGRGIAAFLPPLLRFVWPVLLMIAALALFGWPWAHQQSQQLRDRFENRSDMERVVPGQFQESAAGTRVFFIDRESVSGKSAGDVFIATQERGMQTITSARSGRIETIGPDQFLLLSRGQRMETALADGTIKISEFESYGIAITEKAREIAKTVPPRAVSTLQLVTERSAPFLGELSWRLGLALAAVNFVLIGLVVSSGNPRAGRNVTLFFSLFTFIVYYNLINFGSTRIAAGKFDFWRFLLLLHGGIFAAAALALLKRHHNWSWLPRRRARPQPHEAAA